MQAAGPDGRGRGPGTADRLGACVEACHADRTLADTDRYTCLNNCSQTAKIADKPAQ
ncbi:hypothetical protein [Nannocystis pusilla]|uniref:hypothetical protein n=1 Tax=Nannocystis pusilla TaxID=889268 RepID=UPI003B78B20B